MKQFEASLFIAGLLLGIGLMQLANGKYVLALLDILLVILNLVFWKLNRDFNTQ